MLTAVYYPRNLYVIITRVLQFKNKGFISEVLKKKPQKPSELEAYFQKKQRGRCLSHSLTDLVGSTQHVLREDIDLSKT